MAGIEFDKLSLEQKVNFINSQLQKDVGLSVTKLLKKFGIKENTMKSQLRRGNYKFDENLRKYEKYQNDIKILDADKNINNVPVEDSTEIKIEKYKKNIKVVVEEEDSSKATIEKVETLKPEKYKSNEIIFIQEIEQKKTDLLELLELKEDIKKMLKDHKQRESVIEVLDVQFKIDDDIKGEPVNRSVKLYDKANTELQELYSRYSEMKKCDVLSQIIHEAYLKYKK